MSCNRIRVAVLVSSVRWAAIFCMLVLLGSVYAQDSAAVPPLVKFSGTIAGAPAGTSGVIFALYKDQNGGAPLWQEVQNITVDASGHYTVFLGARSANGLPVELFSNGEARWLGVQPDAQPEQPRVLLVSVPYALKASDAETLGGLPASAFLRTSTDSSAAYVNSSAVNTAAAKIAISAAISGTGNTSYVPVFTDNNGTLGNSALYQLNAGTAANPVWNLGFGTTTPAFNLNFVSQTDPAAIAIDGYGAVGINYIGRRAEGTLAKPTALLVNDNIMAMQGRGYGLTGFSSSSRAYMKFFAAENWSDTAQGTYISLATTLKTTASSVERLRILDNGNVGIGTIAPAYPLSVNGAIQSTGGFIFPDGTSLTSASTTGVHSVTAGDTSVTVSGTAAAPTVAVNTTNIQKRVNGSCPTGEAVSTVNADGSVVCVTAGGTGIATNPSMYLNLYGSFEDVSDPSVTGVSGARLHIDQAIVVTDVAYTASFPGSGVCTPALARVTNGTIYEDIPIAVGVTSYNTADHVVLFPAGSDVSVLVAQAANCGTDYYNPQPPDYLAGSIRYRVANGETVSCPPNLTLVNGSCVDTKSDAQNCGSAGKACAGTSLNIYATCSNGVCGTNGCVTGYADCDGNPANGCEVNTQNNPNNCGSCGYTCPATITNGTAGGCSNSQCVVSCNAGYTQCNNGPNVCTNLKTDALNCGSCYNNCANGIANGTSTGVCTNGSCGYTCNTGYSLCVNSGGYSSCANFQSDATNCGGCGIYCASGICSAGKCQ